jgi:hypothetical protein
MDEQKKDYLFDLNGFRVIAGAVSAADVKAINRWIDEHPATAADAASFEKGEQGKWIGNVEVQSYMKEDGVNYQNVIEGGPVFESLIDAPSWIDDVRRYVGPGLGGPNLSLNENLVNCRGRGGYIGMHSGGHLPFFTTLFRHHTGSWMVGQINIIVALNDIGPGDGCTVVVPGSHRSHIPHPHYDDEGGDAHKVVNYSGPATDAECMVELHLHAGDALMFTDGLAHGSSARKNPGERRILLYRYCPSWVSTRWNYLASPELLARLTEARRQIVQPVKPRMTPGWASANQAGRPAARAGR